MLRGRKLSAVLAFQKEKDAKQKQEIIRARSEVDQSGVKGVNGRKETKQRFKQESLEWERPGGGNKAAEPHQIKVLSGLAGGLQDETGISLGGEASFLSAAGQGQAGQAGPWGRGRGLHVR